MQKVNVSPLNCIHHDCATIPTIVLDFYNTRQRRIMGQIITCSEHKQEGINKGNGMFGRNELQVSGYPQWLRRIHEGVLQNSKVEGKPVDASDIERVRSFMESKRNSAEKK